MLNKILLIFLVIIALFYGFSIKDEVRVNEVIISKNEMMLTISPFLAIEDYIDKHQQYELLLTDEPIILRVKLISREYSGTTPIAKVEVIEDYSNTVGKNSISIFEPYTLSILGEEREVTMESNGMYVPLQEGLEYLVFLSPSKKKHGYYDYYVSSMSSYVLNEEFNHKSTSEASITIENSTYITTTLYSLEIKGGDLEMLYSYLLEDNQTNYDYIESYNNLQKQIIEVYKGYLGS